MRPPPSIFELPPDQKSFFFYSLPIDHDDLDRECYLHLVLIQSLQPVIF